MKQIILKSKQTKAIIFPEAGALVNEFLVNGKDVLFPQQIFQTEDGPKKRGGIPILFPNADPITERTEAFDLKQHGFAREQIWMVDFAQRNRAVLSLSANEETKLQYPFDFLLNLEVELKNNELNYCLTVINPSSNKILPIAPGFHPYFYVPVQDKKNIKVDLPGFDPLTYDFNSTLPFAQQKRVNLLPGGANICLTVSENLKNWTVWSQPDKPFICIEPWVGKRNALLHPDERINIKPGGREKLWMNIMVKNCS